jgi:beta-mannosidase
VLSTAFVSLDMAPPSTFTVALPSVVMSAGETGTSEFLLAETLEQRAWWHPKEDVDAGLPAPEMKTVLDEIPNGHRLEVVAHTFIRDLAVLADRLAPDASVDDMLVTLLPGESATFAIVTNAYLTLEQLTDPLVLRSANQLVAD